MERPERAVLRQSGDNPMKDPQREVEELRAGVNCATVLEKATPPWLLDRKESSKRCLKYRRGAGEIVIVTHGGAGWWDPNSDAKGDVFRLVQHLEPSLNFGEVRKVLRPLAGVRPDFTPDERARDRRDPLIPIAQRWARRPRLRRCSDAWRYLAGRGLTEEVLTAAALSDIVRDGPHGSAWFPHRDAAGLVVHVDVRGPTYKGSLTGGSKALFIFHLGKPLRRSRLVLAEAPIDALSRAAIERLRGDTIAREKLIALGVPASEIAFMQDHKRSAAKQRLFNDMNAGKKRILIGSSETMGTGVNAHRRLVALHHLDVPWLPSQVAQREGRIERQGNQNDEIELFAYATKGSVDATGWQTLERKARFIDMAMSGDPSIRRIEDVGAQANQFGLAKAIASGDQRLIQKAGLEAEIARLERQRDNHFDEQIAIRRKIDRLGRDADEARIRISQIESDIAKRKPTRGDAFEMTVDGKAFRERKDAGALLLMHVRKAETEKPFRPRRIGAVGGFDLRLGRDMFGWPALLIALTGRDEALKCETDLTPLGLVSRLEHALTRFEANLGEMRGVIAQAETWAPSLRTRLGVPFALQSELDERLAELAAINASLAATTADAELDPAAEAA